MNRREQGFPTHKAKARRRRRRRGHVLKMAQTHIRIVYAPPEPNRTGDPFESLRSLP